MGEINLLSILTSCFYGKNGVVAAAIDKSGDSLESPDYRAFFYSQELALDRKKLIDFFFAKKDNLAMREIANNTFTITPLGNREITAYIYLKDISNIGEISTRKHDYVFDKYAILENASVVRPSNEEKATDVVFPIPTHLKDIFVPIGNENTPLKVSGIIKCSCGYESFEIETLNDGDEINGSYVRATCNRCNKAYLIFDSHAHGWDGYVCNCRGKRLPEKDLISFRCDKCNSTSCKLKITISSQGKDDFIKELKVEIDKGQFAKDDWVNAFDWITMDLTCSDCENEQLQFVDYETM